MSSRPTPCDPDFSLRAMRIAVGLYYRWSRLMRRPKKPTRVTEQAYGPHPAERIETIAALPGTPERAPVLYVHGGGWILGKKESYTPFFGFLVDAGYPVYNVGYPLAPENPHPGILRSLFRALDWIRARHPELPGLHVMGDSAGGNLAMMLALMMRNPDLVPVVDPERRAGLPLAAHSVVSLYGVLDRLSWIEDGFPGAETMLECYAGRAAFEPKVDPELAVTPMDLDFSAAPPSLLTCGTEDPLLRSSRLFAERLTAGPEPALLREYPGEGHGFFNLGRTRSADAMNADVLDFLTSQDPHAVRADGS